MKHKRNRKNNTAAAGKSTGNSDEGFASSGVEMVKSTTSLSSGNSVYLSPAPVENLEFHKLLLSSGTSRHDSPNTSVNVNCPMDMDEDITMLKSLGKPLIPTPSRSPWESMAEVNVHNLSNDALAVKFSLPNAWNLQGVKPTISKLPPLVNNAASASSSREVLHNDWDGQMSAWNNLSSTSSAPMSQLPTPKWITVPETEAEKTKRLFDQAMAGWPWTGNPMKMKTIAPWAASGNPWTSRNADNKSSCLLFSKLFDVGLVAALILDIIFQDHSMTCNFSVLCQDSYNIGCAFIHHWDMTHGHFQDCDARRISKYEIIRDPSLARVRQGYVHSVVIVTPIRNGEGPANYCTQIKSIYSMCLASKHFFHNLRNIQFHRVPLLTTHILELLIPKMWRLTFLGVYNCQLINISSALQLLDILVLQAETAVEQNQIRNPHDTLKQEKGKKLIKWDFYPMYHVGPLQIAGTGKGGEFTGSYGCTWDNWNGDSRQAIWCIIAQIIDRTRNGRLVNGTNLLGEGTAFRKWLDKSPCLFVDETLGRMMDPKCSPEEQAAWIRYDKFRGQISRLDTHHMFPKNKTWVTQQINCAVCKIPTMAIFFKWDAINAMANRRGNHPTCQGCELEFVLRKEKDHYKNLKRNIIGKWLTKGRTEMGKHIFEDKDLNTVLDNFFSRRIILAASKLDLARLDHIADAAQGGYEYDRELCERQVPLTFQARNHKVGKRWYSPHIDQTVEEACFDRFDAHGVQW